MTESCQMTTPIAIPLRVSKKKTNVKKGRKAQMSNLTPKQMWDIIRKQSEKLQQQKNRIMKCLKSAFKDLMGKVNNLKRSWKNIPKRLTSRLLK